MKLNKKSIYLVIVVLLSSLQLPAQTSPKEKYIFPINTGQRNYLSGSMGELRTTHFHAGLDIKTGGIEGWPVYAAMDGYVTRIRVSTGGYGNSLYILHPNGHSTVYAHLSYFDPMVAEFVRAAQYRNKSFEIELFPEKNQFFFKAGQQIGLSGNSGSSGGPHLHFEIRDPYQRILNPLNYGFDEIIDKIPPVVKKVALRSMNIDSRVKGEFGRMEFPVKAQGRNFIVEQPITVNGSIGLELLAHDLLDGASNRNGIAHIKAYVNDELFYHQSMDTMSFALQKNILVHYDYEVRKKTGDRYHKLYKEPGNTLLIYKTLKNEGHLVVNEGDDLLIKVVLTDSYGNKSELQLNLKGAPVERNSTSKHHSIIEGAEWEWANNHIIKIVESDSCSTRSGVVHYFPNQSIIEPDYTLQNANVYHWDLNKGLPDSINFCSSNLKFNFVSTVLVNTLTTVYDRDFSYTFSKNSLFDDLHFESSQKLVDFHDFEIFSIGSPNVPLRGNIEVRFKTNGYFQEYQEKTAAYAVDDEGNFNFAGGKFEQNEFVFSISEMGDYTMLIDSIPPTIKPIKISKEHFAFEIDDALSGIKTYELKVGNEWVLMKYEPKKKMIWSDFPRGVKQMEGELVLKVTDQSGNESMYNTKL